MTKPDNKKSADDSQDENKPLINLDKLNQPSDQSTDTATKPNDPNKDNQTKTDPSVRPWYALSFIGKVILLIVVLLLGTVGTVYYLVGTPWGTQQFIKAVVSKTGISLKYGKGNLRDGLWVYDIKIPAKPPKSYIEITVDKAYVKIGWRALLTKEVHLREANIGTMKISYKKPPNNLPFQYTRVAIPVNVILDHATADLVRYQQVTKQPLDFKQAKVQDFSWIVTQIKVADGNFDYNESLGIQHLKGHIDLEHNYPLDAQANILVRSLNKVHFEALDTHATGSLRFLAADVKSRYNQSDISGSLVAQPLEKNAPFNAKLVWKDVELPYAVERHIHLKNGLLVASGVTDNIQLRLNTDLTAKDIPSGHYQGRGYTNGKKLEIEHLTAKLPEGTLVSQGIVDWQDRTRVALMNIGNGFKIRRLLSTDIAPYAPETLTGKLAVVYDAATEKLPMTIRANLRQDDGEMLNAIINQAKDRAKTNQQPYHINANWQHLIRHNLPNIGYLNSPNGKAVINYLSADKKRPARLEVDGSANILALNVAPRGDYQVKLQKVGQKIDIGHFNYQGVVGDLTGVGQIQLAYGQHPLSWQVNAHTTRFNAHDVFANLPLQNLRGRINASGVMQVIRQAKGTRLNRHTINISEADLSGNLLGANHTSKYLTLKGAGRAQIDLMGNQLRYLATKFDGSLTAPKVPDGKLSLDIAGTPKQLQINRFSHQSTTGGIEANGSIDLTDGIGWQLNANMQHFDASYFVPSLPSKITGNIVTDGYWRQAVQYIHIANMNLSGVLKNQPLTATGQLLATLHIPQDMSTLRQVFNTGNQSQQVSQVRRIVERLQANNVLIQWGKNRITASGNQNQLVASVDISTLNQLVAQLRGTLKGGLVLTQDNVQTLPNIYVDLVGHDIAVPNFSVLDAKITGKLVDFAKLPSQLQINATGLNIANQPLRALQVYFNGTQASHTLDVKADSSRGQIQATLKGQVDFVKKQWQGLLGNGQIGTQYAKLQQLQPAQLLFNWQQPTVQLAAHCWQMVGQGGHLCLKDNLLASANQGQINLSAQQIDTQIFAMVMPKDITWTGNLNGNALIRWQRNQRPNVNATFYSDNGVFGTAAQSPEDEPTTLAYERISVIARSMADGLKLRADLHTANAAGVGYLDATINPYKTPKPINGTLVFQDINLAVFKPFFPTFERLTGNGLVAGKISGTLEQPHFLGDVEVQNGTIGITGVPMRFNNINALAHVEGSQAQIDGRFATANQGNGTVTGTVDWHNDLQAKLKIQGDRLYVSQPPLVTAEINPVVDVIVRPNQRYVNIVGVVDVPRATIRPPEANKDVVTKSNDVYVIDRRLANRIDEVLRVTKPWSINADIGVDLGRSVNFQGFGTRLPLAGALSITERGQGPMQARGVVQVARRSKVEVFGQSLDINFAQVRFDGSLNQPTLNIEAVKDVQGVQVGVQVRGKANQPNISVFNSGGLSQQQAMNALVTGNLNNSNGQGTTTQDFVNRVNNTLAAAGLSYGLSGTRGITNQIGRAFGLQSLTLDASGTSSDTEVNITGYITPDLYIRYGVGVFNSTNVLSARYQLTRRLYIEARSAVNKSVDLIYNWRY